MEQIVEQSPELSNPEPEKVLTDKERIDNIELVIAKLTDSLNEVLGNFLKELQKTQRAVLALMEKGTAKQQKLLLPQDARVPFRLIPKDPA